MGRSVDALIEPKLLVWARKSSGMSIDHASQRAGVKPEKLQSWEAGTLVPTISQLKKIAKVYKRPLSVFYLDEVPSDFQPMHDFRRAPNSPTMQSPELVLEIRRAWERREVALELAQDAQIELVPIPLTASIKDNPTNVAQAIRKLLGVKMVDQSNWKDGYRGLRNWKFLIEARGALVFQTVRVPLSEARGLSISQSLMPVIVLNGQDWANGKIFTLLHEFVHLILHDGGICDLHDPHFENAHPKTVEAFCNLVAGQVLVPAEYLERHPLVESQRDQVSWADGAIDRLARDFCVSRDVIVRRLALLGAMSESELNEKIATYRLQHDLATQALKEERALQEGGPSFYRQLVSRNGIRYTQLVLGSFHDDLISAGDVSEFLGVKVGGIPRIEQEVMSASSPNQ